MSEAVGLNEKQRTIVDETTVMSVMSGLAIRYHDSLRTESQNWERYAKNVGDPGAIAAAYESVDAMQAEAPIAFSLEPSNMAVCVKAIKVDPNTGVEISRSAVQVGLVGGLAKDGQPSGDFNSEDLSLAVQRLKEQKQAGLVYGLRTSSGFLAGY